VFQNAEIPADSNAAPDLLSKKAGSNEMKKEYNQDNRKQLPHAKPSSVLSSVEMNSTLPRLL